MLTERYKDADRLHERGRGERGRGEDIAFKKTALNDENPRNACRMVTPFFETYWFWNTRVHTQFLFRNVNATAHF